MSFLRLLDPRLAVGSSLGAALLVVIDSLLLDVHPFALLFLLGFAALMWLNCGPTATWYTPKLAGRFGFLSLGQHIRWWRRYVATMGLLGPIITALSAVALVLGSADVSFILAVLSLLFSSTSIGFTYMLKRLPQVDEEKAGRRA